MKNLIIFATVVFFLFSSFICACSEDEDHNINDGDIDSLESDVQGENSTDNEAEEQVQDPQCYTRADDSSADFDDACILEDVCCPKGCGFLNGTGDIEGDLNLCEESDCSGVTDIYPIWPGPGFGLGLVGNGSRVPTGWYGPECWSDPEIVWTDKTKAAIADRTPKDKDCSTITDAFTCATTHNPPAHCAMTIGWPLYVDDDGDCRSDHTCAGVKGAVFLGCHQEYEPGAIERLGIEEDSEHYSGPVRNTENGDCLGYSDYEDNIPAGWEKTDCASCMAR